MARSDAMEVRARITAGERPALAGVPVIVKDNIWVAGRLIAQGSRLFADHIAPRDAIAVAGQAALAGSLPQSDRDVVAFTLDRIEAALRARAVANA